MGTALTRLRRPHSFRSSRSSEEDGEHVPAAAALEPNFRWLEGRPYVGSNSIPYMLASDDEEIDRLHQQHFILKHVCDGENYMAPIRDLIKPGSKLLDLGCGTGVWCCEMAQQFPEAEVHGLDLVANFPTAIMPRNCRFHVGNVLDPLNWEDATFDYVFMRIMYATVPLVHWNDVLSEVLRILKPGGILEIQDFDISSTRPVSPDFLKLHRAICKMISGRGLDPRFGYRAPELLYSAGFVDVYTTRRSIPIGSWAGKIGELWAENVLSIATETKPWLADLVGWQDQEFYGKLKKVYTIDVAHDHAYQNFHFSWGTKPRKRDRFSIRRESKRA